MLCGLRFRLLVCSFSIALSGCAAIPPNFDVPSDVHGTPSTGTIVQRIKCELIDLIRDDVPQPYKHRKLLLGFDYEVAMLLSLDVNDTGGLAPSFNLPYGNFAFNLGANVNQSREDTLNINLTYSMRELAHRWDQDRDLSICPAMDTNLAGNLGLRRMVTSALDTPDMVEKADLSPTGGEFGGIVNFVLTRNLNSTGPTWTLTHFAGPGNLASVSRVNTDKLSFGFAVGKNAGTPFKSHQATPPSTFAGANRVLEQQLINNLGTQLSGIRSLQRLP
ncbi:hypothetical protein IVB44_25875 [Bradyrhizobium sp. 49]|uniref:hypothetical protein n=1 Tax=unclassified Bradyrhizobium TaxID=2631580 RepID=UPI001FF8517C|nr:MULTISPECIES: hypothetical protein [unclassified Bradyrhizobium]MCK1267244.1 hypothetical protein [Bradyrhizobium sp. 84]MCK1374373.1 hypothetical protein [Bradyrhizobium sp. 49]